jgi:hypothetical protein
MKQKIIRISSSSGWIPGILQNSSPNPFTPAGRKNGLSYLICFSQLPQPMNGMQDKINRFSRYLHYDTKSSGRQKIVQGLSMTQWTAQALSAMDFSGGHISSPEEAKA